MHITNEYALPEVLVKACLNQRKPTPQSISVTELIDSPLIRKLKLQHWDNLEADVSEMVWAMTGTALHQMVEKHGDTNNSEVKLSTEFEGFTITGTCDHLTPERISDWKTTSVWSVMLGNDWLNKVEQQLNLYRWLHLKMTGQIVPRVTAVVIFRDWRKSEFRRNPNDYPPRNIIEFELKPYTIEQIEQFVRDRLSYVFDENYVCSMTERWAKPSTYAVKKQGAVRATRVFDTLEQANSMLATNVGMELEIRQGEHTRCNDYCPVRDVCPHKIGTFEHE